jgi:hypothetical protein
MINVTMENVGPQVDDATLDALEASIVCALPVAYREFLKTTNGGRPMPDQAFIEDWPESPTDVVGFYRVELPLTTCELVFNLRAFADRIPAALLPIGYDSLGNQFCTVINGPGIGRIYYADFEYVGARGVIFFVADDIQAFLRGLRPPGDE